MKAFGSFTAFFVLILCASALERARYDHYHVVKVAIETDLQYQVMQQIEENPDGVSRSGILSFQIKDFKPCATVPVSLLISIASTSRIQRSTGGSTAQARPFQRLD